jgi:hypothetical protein
MISYTQSFRQVCPTLQSFTFHIRRHIDGEESAASRLVEFTYRARSSPLHSEGGALSQVLEQEGMIIESEIGEDEVVYRFDPSGLTA